MHHNKGFWCIGINGKKKKKKMYKKGLQHWGKERKGKERKGKEKRKRCNGKRELMDIFGTMMSNLLW